MAPRFQQGQRVVINPANVAGSSLRETELSRFAGQIGVVKDYYWITLDRGMSMFYIYNVQMESGNHEMVLHEDELEEFLGY